MYTPILSEPVVACVRPIGDYCGINYMTAFKRLTAGTLPGELIAGRWVSRKSELDAWIAAQTAPPVRYRKRADA